MKLISDRKSKKLEKKVTNKLAPGTTLDRNKRFIDKFLKNIINFNKKILDKPCHPSNKKGMIEKKWLSPY